MDELLGRAPGTYGRFERGLPTSVTPEFLKTVAEILIFDERQWTALWLFAVGHAPPGPLNPSVAAQIGPHWQGIVDAHGQMAYVTDAGWNLLVSNALFRSMFPGGVAPRNVMRWMILHPDARRRCLVDWERSWASLVLPQLHAALAEHQTNETLLQLRKEIRADPVAGPLFKATREAYIQPDGDRRMLWHAGMRRRGVVTIGVSTVTGSHGARLMILPFEPEDRGPSSYAGDGGSGSMADSSWGG